MLLRRRRSFAAQRGSCRSGRDQLRLLFILCELPTLIVLFGLRCIGWQDRRLDRSIVPWKSGIEASLDKAETLLQSQNATDTSDKIAVLLLSRDARQLCCALRNFQDNLMEATPLHIYIFSQANQLQLDFQEQGCPLLTFHPYFLALDEHWVTPEEAENQSLWTSWFNDEYRRMGHWRLVFQMEFAAKLGYQYVLQLDDDSDFLQPLKTNLLEFMKQNSLDMATREIIASDVQDVTLGLAELTKYFLVVEKIQPTLLFAEDCFPQDISGLYTAGLGGPQDGGYSTRFVYGNFVIISLDFWFQEPVQRFVRLVMRTGGHFRFRWNEQAVQSIVWQIFIPEKKMHVFDFPYQHPHKSWHDC